MSAVRAGADTQARRAAVLLFLPFAFAYFLSALLRAVTATLAPALRAEFNLSSGQLGLLAGAFFLGFASTQLPLGRALDRFGPRRVLLGFLSVAVIACAASAMAQGFGALLAARALTGVGVSACLMAPLTAYRLRFSPSGQLRASSWMLMTGSLGMLASTLPVQTVVPLIGWRGLFGGVAGLLACAWVAIAIAVPADVRDASRGDAARVERDAGLRYVDIFRHAHFMRLAPLAFVVYGSLIAVQALWAGPWLTDVVGMSESGAAQGLFAINLAMLFAFLTWGVVMPHFAKRGVTAEHLMSFGVPVSLTLLLAAVLMGQRAGPLMWAAWCVSCSCISLSQSSVALSFPAAAAGRVLSAFNLVIFLGVFSVQWGVGLMLDALSAWGLARSDAFRGTFALLAVASCAAYAWFVWRGRAMAAMVR